MLKIVTVSPTDILGNPLDSAVQTSPHLIWLLPTSRSEILGHRRPGQQAARALNASYSVLNIGSASIAVASAIMLAYTAKADMAMISIISDVLSPC